MDRYQDFIDYLKSFNVRDEQIEIICKKINTKNLSKIKPRINFYKEYLNIDGAEMGRFIELAPSVLAFEIDGDSPTVIKKKLAFFKDFFKVNDEQLAVAIKRTPILLYYDVISDSPTSFKSKAKFIKNELNLSDKELRIFLFKNTQILAFDTNNGKPSSIKTRIDLYKKLLNASTAEIKKMSLRYMPLLIHTPENMTAFKFKPLKKILKFQDKEFADFIKKYPQLLCYACYGDNPKSIESKLKFYKETLLLNDDEVINLVKEKPVILTLDTTTDRKTSVQSKMEAFTECMPFEEVRERIIENPKLLTVPAQQFKIRYMLAYNLGIENKFMTNEQKIWARYCYLKDDNYKDFRKVNIDEKGFENEFKVSLDELLEHYPLDEAAICDIEQTFYATTGQELKLNQEEREAVLGR